MYPSTFGSMLAHIVFWKQMTLPDEVMDNTQSKKAHGNNYYVLVQL